jgi:CRP-like cAMP-binding protein
MCGILRHQVETIQILATPSAEQRIAAALLRLAGEDIGNGAIEIAYRRKDIAEMTGLSLETTIRAVRRLARKNCLTIVGGRIILESTTPLRNLIR